MAGVAARLGCGWPRKVGVEPALNLGHGLPLLALVRVEEYPPSSPYLLISLSYPQIFQKASLTSCHPPTPPGFPCLFFFSRNPTSPPRKRFSLLNLISHGSSPILRQLPPTAPCGPR